MVETETDLTEIDWLPRLSVCPLTEQAIIGHSSTFDQVSSASTSSSLACKPPFSYGALIKMAIGSTPDMQMTLSEIYRWVSNNFDYYKYCPSPSWKNSIRHNLSLSKHFLKVPRGPDDPGKGSYWTVDTLLASSSKHKTRGKFLKKAKKKRQTLVVTPYKPEGSAISNTSIATNLPEQHFSNLAPLSINPSCKEEFASHHQSSTEPFYEGVFEDSSLLRSIIELVDIPFEQHAKNISREECQLPESKQMNRYVQPIGFSNNEVLEEDFDWDSLFNPNVF